MYEEYLARKEREENGTDAVLDDDDEAYAKEAEALITHAREERAQLVQELRNETD